MRKIKLFGVFGLAVAYSLIAFAQTKISQLPTGATLTGSELIPMVQSGTTVTTTPSAIAGYVGEVGGVNFANPTAQVGTSVVNGSATTAMRSDAAPSINQGISPTWTGNHTFSPSSGTATTVNAAAGVVGSTINSSANNFGLGITSPGTSKAGVSMIANGNVYNSTDFQVYQQANAGYIYNGASGYVYVYTNGTEALQIGLSSIHGYGPGAAGLIDMTPDHGVFLITYNGMTTAVTGSAVWVRHGEMIVLFFPAGVGTSNAPTLTATGLPSEIQVARTQSVPGPVGACENNNQISGQACMVTFTASSGTITLANNTLGGAWTSSGGKGVANGFTVTYEIY